MGRDDRRGLPLFVCRPSRWRRTAEPRGETRGGRRRVSASFRTGGQDSCLPACYFSKQAYSLPNLTLNASRLSTL